MGADKAKLKALVRRGLIMHRNSDYLSDVFALEQERAVRRQLAGFVGELGNRILRFAGQTGGEQMVSGMLRELDIRLDLTAIPDIYEKTASDATEYIREMQKVISKDAVGFVFDEVDTAVLEMIRNSFFWMQADHTDVLIEEVKAVIETAFAGEVAREALPALLEDRFGLIIQAESRYFKDVCDHIISQGQNMARVAQGSKYAVPWYKVMARMDDRTTEFCRSVNGKLISAAHVEKQGEKILGAKNTAQKKESAAWPKKDGPLKGTLPKNIGIPPYHYRCRTILQPYWPDEYEIAKLKIA